MEKTKNENYAARRAIEHFQIYWEKGSDKSPI